MNAELTVEEYMKI